MKGLYEQNWKNAIEGAKVEPSEALWENIASNLDKAKGRNYWVTFLMIAATVTIAFSFPLTIGNSAFESRPDTNLSTTNNSNDLVEDAILQLEASNPNTESSEQEINQKHSVNSGKNVKAGYSNPSAIPSSSGLYIVKNANPQGTGFGTFSWNNNFRLANISTYYLIPYFMPLNKYQNRDLLASINMGTGSSSSNGGLLNGISSETTQVVSLSNSNDSFSNTTYKNESKVTTFYIGAGVELPLGKRWSLLTGFGYLANKAEGTNNVVKDGEKGYQPLGAFDPIGSNTVFLSKSYHYSLSNNYISVPISVKYPIINRKLKFRAGGGISTDFMLNHVVNSETYKKASYTPSEVNYNPVVLSGLINLDVNYSINKHYSIALETGLRKGITSIDKSKERYPSSFTVGIVLLYKIR